MSKTDKTQPWRLTCDRRYCGYPCKHMSISKGLAVYVRKANRHARTELRNDLAAGREPSTDQHRHSAFWDAS